LASQIPNTVESRTLAHYEGLVAKTAWMLVGRVEYHELDDLKQVLWIKVLQAVRSYEHGRSRLSRDRYVFMCLVNLTKDLTQRKKRGERFIEDLAAGHDDVYGDVEPDEFRLPNTLIAEERAVVIQLYAGYKKTEIMRTLCIGHKEFDRRMDSILGKLADWRPPTEVVEIPTPV
jgi:DNA-directed RNA polymerase specialized sigma24 family protein